jgi:hypothetical protein
MDRHCDRRDFLRVTGAGLLGAGLAGAIVERAAAAAPKAKAKSVIGVYLDMGWTHIDTFDPKPNAPPAVRSFFKNIPTNVPGTEITELFPLMAKCADKYTIIRSITAPGGGHGGYVMQCNAMNPKESPSTHPSAKLIYPHVGAVIGMKKVEDGGYKGDIPPWCCIPGLSFMGNNYGFLPPKCQGYGVGYPDQNDRFYAPGVSLSPDEQKRLEKRRALLEAVEKKGKTPAAQTADALRQSTFRLLSGEAKQLFDLSTEKKETLERYGKHPFAKSCLLARRLAEYGVPFTSVNWGGGDVQGSFGWDMHEQVNKSLRLLCPILDQAVSALFEDLAQRGTLKDTIVIMFSESSKAPEWNVKPETLGGKHPGETGAGREHYNEVMCAVVGGGGFKVGRVLGESDDEGRHIKSRAVYPWDLWESVYQLMGIDPQDRLPNPDGCTAYVSPATACSYARGGILKEIME